MKPSFSTLAAATFAFGLFLTAGTLSAQTTKTIKGDFKSSDGNKGTFVRTVVTNGATTTDTTVFTRKSDEATRTDVETRTANTDGTHAVTVSHLDFGATAAYTAQKTVSNEKHGEFVGKGTYTTPTGDTGTLSTLESANGPINVVSATHTSATTGVAQFLDLDDDEFAFSASKHIELAPDGTVTAVLTTKYITGF